jgi:hypothetical protein
MWAASAIFKNLPKEKHSPVFKELEGKLETISMPILGFK